MTRADHVFRGGMAGRARGALLAFGLAALTAGQVAAQSSTAATDWPNLARYREANAQLAPPTAGENRVVFYGNSITEGWAPLFPAMFPGKPYVGRGISGQTTP